MQEPGPNPNTYEKGEGEKGWWEAESSKREFTLLHFSYTKRSVYWLPTMLQRGGSKQEVS